VAPGSPAGGLAFPEVSGSERSGAWDPGEYLRFAGERARPFLELVARIDVATPGAVVDLGCGDGSTTALLADRWPAARVTGLDSSREMLAAAPRRPGLDFRLGDVRDWRPQEPVDVLVCNAVLHWVPDHDRLLLRWAEQLAPGGALAVQVPGNFRAPTHALLAALCRSQRWAEQLGDVAPSPSAVPEPAGYLEVLTGAGLSADVWETTYLHVLSGDDPVLGWVRSTVLRPVLARLDRTAAAAFTAEYAAALRRAYPRRADGSTVLPFRRLFAVGTRPG